MAKTLVLLLVGYGLYQNRLLKSLYLVLLGLFLNALVIFANGGHMPVSLQALERAGVEGWEAILKERKDAVHTLLDESTRLAFLGDVIALPPLRKAISLGDAFILLGLMGVVVEGTLRVRRLRPTPFRLGLASGLLLLACLWALGLV